MSNHSDMSAMLTAPSSTFDSTWYPDSSATNHITPDLGDLTNKASYVGNDQIHIGDGTGLDIHNVGTSFFHTNLSSKVFNLNNLLHVPSITKNLMSVSKFA